VTASSAHKLAQRYREQNNKETTYDFWVLSGFLLFEQSFEKESPKDRLKKILEFFTFLETAEKEGFIMHAAVGTLILSAVNYQLFARKHAKAQREYKHYKHRFKGKSQALDTLSPEDVSALRHCIDNADRFYHRRTMGKGESNVVQDH